MLVSRSYSSGPDQSPSSTDDDGRGRALWSIRRFATTPARPAAMPSTHHQHFLQARPTTRVIMGATRPVDLARIMRWADGCGPRTGHTVRPEPVIEGHSAAVPRQIGGDDHVEPHGLLAGGSIARPSRGRRGPEPFRLVRPPGRPGSAVQLRPPSVGRPVFGTQCSLGVCCVAGSNVASRPALCPGGNHQPPNDRDGNDPPQRRHRRVDHYRDDDEGRDQNECGEPSLDRSESRVDEAAHDGGCLTPVT